MAATDQLPDTPRWRGINHLALVTPDMDATVRFYVGLLGMRARRHHDGGPDAPLLLRDGHRQHGGVLRGEGRRRRSRSPRVPRATVPSSSTTSPSTSPTSTRSRCCASGSSRPAPKSPRSSTTASSGRSTSPTPTESHSKRRGGWSTAPAVRPTTPTERCSPIRTPCPRWTSSRAGGIDALPQTRLV